jgi:hypothetical protein
MKNIQATIYLLLTSFFIMSSAQAHDPSEHMKKNEAPKCETMKTMDHSKMNASDPIMMAMTKKCMTQAQANKEELDMDHSKMEMDHSNMEMDHSKMGMDHGNMKMDHSKMGMDHGNMKMDHSKMKGKVKESTQKAADDHNDHD